MCAEAGKTDLPTLAVARAAARRWAQLIWLKYDWRESQVLFYQTVAASATILYLPPIVERIIQARIDTNTNLMATEAGTWFQLDSTMFEQQGNTYGLIELPSIGTSIATPTETLKLATTNAGDAGVIVFIRGDQAGVELHEAITLTAGTVSSVNTYDVIYEVSKPNTTLGDVILSSGTSATALGTIKSYESERKYLRLQLMGQQTTASTTALVLAKRKCPVIHSDSQSTPLRNMDLAMMALVTASVWNYVRQKADGAADMQLFSDLVQSMIDAEIKQSGIQKKLIPSDVYSTGGGGLGYDHSDPLGQSTY